MKKNVLLFVCLFLVVGCATSSSIDSYLMHIEFDRGEAALEEKKFEDARKHFEFSKESAQRVFGVDHFSEAEAEWGIAESYFLESNYTEAQKYYERAFKIYEGNKQGAPISLLINYGDCSGRLGNFKKAILLFERAVNLSTKENGLDNETTTLAKKFLNKTKEYMNKN